VTVVDGPLRGLNGIHSGLTASERETILLTILDATRPVAIASHLIATAH
jgi:hypothetical protein